MSFFSSVLVLALFIFLILGCLFLLTPIFSRVPYIPTRRKVIRDVLKEMNFKDGDVLYDLGCGDGRFLFTALKCHSNITCVGVEKAPFPFLLAKFRQIWSGNKNISIIYGDLFKTDTSSATHVFVYLFPKFMDRLLPKFEKELKPGTRVFSCAFEFSNKKPSQILDFKSKSYQLNQRIYFYDF